VTRERRTWFDERGLVIAPNAASAVSLATGTDASTSTSVTTRATSVTTSVTTSATTSTTSTTGARHVPFYAGAMHYWRVARSSWAACLRTMHAQGFTLVESYVPWRVHEPTAGTYDWSGDRDLRAFCEAASAAGLSVVLRLGPHFNAELTSFGIPDHVLADEECRARTSRGTPAWMPAPPRAFPIPSYASRAFHAKVAGWYTEVARVLGASTSQSRSASTSQSSSASASQSSIPAASSSTSQSSIPAASSSTSQSSIPAASSSTSQSSIPAASSSTSQSSIPAASSSASNSNASTSSADAHVGANLLAPEGPVVAIGVDNEAQMFFRASAYDLDYHPDAIEWWRDSTGLDGDPPRAWDPAERTRCVSWVRFKDHYVSRALGEFAKALDGAGFGGLARFHNLPPGHHALSDLRGIQHAIKGPVGIDAYTPRADFRRLRRSASSLVGNASPVPIAMEVGVGFFPWFPPLDDGNDPARERDHVLSLLAVGARGFNLYMAVERERYYGAAISKRGQLEKHAQWIHPLIHALVEHDWTSLRRATPIALVDTRADLRFGLASTVADPITPVVADLLGFGPGGPAELGTDADARVARRWQDAIASALELAQVPYAIVDESASEDELATYRAVIAPTLSRIDRGLWQRLRALAEHKRAIVVIGPTTPTHDELGQPLPADPPPKRVGKIREGSLDDVPGLAADLQGLAGDLGDAWQIERPDDVRCFAHADASGVVRVVFVVSDAPKETTAVLLVDERTQTLSDPLSKDAVRASGGRVTIAMPPRGVRMLVVR
jgi:beta-galactosidase